MINEFGEKRVKKNIGRLIFAITRANNIDLLLTFVLAEQEIARRGISESDKGQIREIITKQSK